ncbi:MAG: hypothetical protein JNL79_13030 [Myxococcales bacterium]|nr:hypothetical protein [Myxococcales bacterium]
MAEIRVKTTEGEDGDRYVLTLVRDDGVEYALEDGEHPPADRDRAHAALRAFVDEHRR